MVLSSFKTQHEIFRMPPSFLPVDPVLSNYGDALALLPSGQEPVSEIFPGLLNSIKISATTTLILLVIASPAGYAFSKIHFPGKQLLLITLLMLRMLPGIVLAVPLYILATKTKMIDTKLLLIVIYTALNLPLTVWLLSVFFQEIPQDIEDAAVVDGCNRLSLLYRIYLPLSRPALATVAILGFLAVWNEFMFAVLLTSTAAAKTAPVALASMQATYKTRWAIMTAGGVLQTLPTLLIAFFMQRHIIKGLTLGAVKE